MLDQPVPHPPSVPKNNRLFGENLLILTIGELLSRGLVAIAFIRLARVLMPSNYGMLELTLAVIMVLTVVVDQGTGPIGTREIARHPSGVKSLVERIVSMQLRAAFIVFVLLAFFVILLDINLILSVLLIGYGISLVGYPFLLNWLFQGWNQMEWVAIPQVVRQTVFAAVVLLLVNQPDRILLLPLIEIISVAITGVIYILVYRRLDYKFSIKLRSGFDRNLFFESIPVGGTQIIWALRMYLPTIIIGFLAGEAAVGYFGAPHRIVMVTQGFLVVYFNNIFPAMSELSFTSFDRLRGLLQSSLRLVVWPSIALALATTIGARMIINIMFGSDYLQAESTNILIVLIWLIPILVWRGHSRTALISINHQRDELLCSISGIIMLLVLLPVLTSRVGSVGAAWAMVISEVFATGLAWWRLKINIPDIELKQYVFHLPSLALLVSRFGGSE